MGLEDIFQRIDSLKKAWDEAQPLKPADSERLWKKLRLEWNYNSNHIEGNTLTYGETELLLIFGKTTGEHTIREYEEMKAHDAAIQHIRDLAKEPRIISEADVRALNQLILKEPFWKPAITADGQETRKQIIPGDYKTAPNNVRTATGEIFQFADPLDTPARMQALVVWLQERLAKKDQPIAEVISRLHYDFVLIHPFDDGNGRVARLLVNYVLLHLGFPPVVIKSKDKRNYLAALNRADTGDRDAFTEYLAKEAVWALELGLRAAKGESIEEPDDLDKEIAVFVRSQTSTGKVALQRNVDLLEARLQDSWLPLIDEIYEKLRPLTKVFHRAKVVLDKPLPEAITTDWEGWPRLKTTLATSIQDIPRRGSSFGNYLSLWFEFSGYIPARSVPFDYKGGVALHWGDYSYSIHGTPSVQFPTGPLSYDKTLTSEEISTLSQLVVRAIFEDLKKTAER